MARLLGAAPGLIGYDEGGKPIFSVFVPIYFR